MGDDLILRTAMLSPVKLDKELMKLLWEHTDIWVPNPDETDKKKSKKINDNSGGSYRKFSERDFYNQISYIDKQMLLWGVYNVTYGSLGVQDITCDKCNTTFQQNIIIDDTLHDDSITIFEHDDVPFNEYTEQLKYPLDDNYSVIFDVKLPSMADFNRLMGLVSMSELQSNLENIHSNFTTEQLMTMYTKKLSVVNNNNPNEIIESTSSQEILSSIRDCLNIEISNKFLTEYSEKFGKYGINFYHECKCPQCSEIIKTPVNIEYQFFLRQLSDRP